MSSAASTTSTTSSVSSASSLVAIDHQDPDVQLAVEALGSMARGMTLEPKPTISINYSAPSTTPSSPLPTPTSQKFPFPAEWNNPDEAKNKDFMHRMSNLPIVNSALRVYESSKASSSYVKYGAEMVESLAAPIYDKVGRRVLSNVDTWGCRQLDRFEDKSSLAEEDGPTMAAHALARATISDHHEQARDGLRRRTDPREDPYTKTRSRSCSRSTSPHRPYTLAKTVVRHRTNAVPRSRWQQIVAQAGSAAGTTAAVVSEESMKCLRYCLSWLEYAVQHIDQQMNLLRNFLVSLASKDNKSGTVAVSSSAATLASIKKEMVDTLRKVVEVVSRYAGSGLPEQAKASVRAFILALPGRWAVLNTTTTTVSPTSSPSMNPHTPSHVQDTSIKLLNFGGESIEMLHSVATVFSDTIDRAELWLDRLRVVGVSQVQSHMDIIREQGQQEHGPKTERMDMT
ncbi:transcription factor Opi1-domain-containing protein [Phycomyces nitens]|nr:transcription factor Opi1-domain-containing protein [Phycomyces nitens]